MPNIANQGLMILKQICVQHAPLSVATIIRDIAVLLKADRTVSELCPESHICKHSSELIAHFCRWHTSVETTTWHSDTPHDAGIQLLQL